MNIFVLSEDPVIAAQYMCNKHIPKMVVETAQLLCTAHPKEVAPYKHTHFNHPCAVWTRASLSNYAWLIRHANALCSEYTFRYEKRHKTQDTIEWCEANVPAIPDIGLTPFARAISDSDYHYDDVVVSYRAYYVGDKSSFARWRPHTEPPPWWPWEDVPKSKAKK